MNGIDLLNNLIDELIRAREIVEKTREFIPDTVNELVNDIDVDLGRYYDYADSINALIEDIEIE